MGINTHGIRSLENGKGKFENFMKQTYVPMLKTYAPNVLDFKHIVTIKIPNHHNSPLF